MSWLTARKPKEDTVPPEYRRRVDADLAASVSAITRGARDTEPITAVEAGDAAEEKRFQVRVTGIRGRSLAHTDLLTLGDAVREAESYGLLPGGVPRAVPVEIRELQ